MQENDARATSGAVFVKTAAALVALLLAGLAWEMARALGSPMDWLAHGGPGRLLALSAASIIPAFVLGAWTLTRPGSRAPLVLMAVVGALPAIAILNGSVYRTAVVKSVGFTSGKLQPVAKAVEEQLVKHGVIPADISGLLADMDGLGEVRLFSGQGYFILATGGYEGQEEGGLVYYHSKTGEWKRFHADRRQSPAAKEFFEATEGLAPSWYIRGPDGHWRKKAQPG